LKHIWWGARHGKIEKSQALRMTVLWRVEAHLAGMRKTRTSKKSQALSMTGLLGVEAHLAGCEKHGRSKKSQALRMTGLLAVEAHLAGMRKTRRSKKVTGSQDDGFVEALRTSGNEFSATGYWESPSAPPHGTSPDLARSPN
jgi:hypothetical protein